MAVLFTGFSVLMSVATPASATEFRKGDAVNVKKGEVIKGDLFATGEHIRIDGEVDGDVYAFAHQVDVTGHINGDLICFAQAVRVSGVIDGNLRTGANNVTVTGTIERNAMSWSETLNLDSNGKIGRSLTAGGETLTLDGRIGRDFLGFADTTTISGFIGGSVREQGKSLSIVSGAQIDGKTSFKGQKGTQRSIRRETGVAPGIHEDRATGTKSAAAAITFGGLSGPRRLSCSAWCWPA